MGLSMMQVLVMAAAAGVTVANIYYSQPILPAMAATIHASQGQIGWLPVLTQAGYGSGLLLLTPMGDMIDRKRLVIVLEVLLSLALIGMTMVGSLAGLYAASFLIGILAVSVQIIMPLSAALAAKESKGKVVGIVFTGCLIGILAARVVSGYVAEWLGWRAVYGISAGFVLMAALVVTLTLPTLPSHHSGSYGALLRSTLYQVKRFPVLRRATLLGVLVFGAFCSFWTTLTFHLSGPPFHYRSDIIGLFGVLAIAGAMASSLFGRLSDKGNPARAQLLTIGLMIVSVLLVQWLPHSVAALIVATVLLDIGVQATQVTNLAQIYALDETAHSRINTVYMTTMFIGGAIGTFAGVLSWTTGGWALVSWQLLTWSLLALALVLWGQRAGERSLAPATDAAGR